MWMLIVTGKTPDAAAEKRLATAAGHLLNDPGLGVVHARFSAICFDGDPRTLDVSQAGQDRLRAGLQDGLQAMLAGTDYAEVTSVQAS